jgi:hypothetical protein
VTLVESPRFDVGNVQLSHLSEDIVVSLNSALEDGSVSNIELEVLFLEGLSSGNSFLHSVWSEVDIIPSSESILEIPDRLSVSEEYHSVGSLLTSFLHDLN